MDFEILDRSDSEVSEPGPPGRLSRFSWIMLATLTSVCLGAGMLLVNGTDPSDPAAVRIAPPPVLPTFPSEPISVPHVGLADNLVIGYTCMPIFGPDRTTAVSFQVMNASQNRITVNSITPGRHQHGLRGLVHFHTTEGGSCNQPGDESVGGVLSSGDSQLFTLWYRRAKSCAQSVQADVPIAVTQMAGMTTKAVSREIGTLFFNNNCPPDLS
jgi:hypothetical protein